MSKRYDFKKKVPAAAGIQTIDFSFASQVLYHLNTVCCVIIFQKKMPMNDEANSVVQWTECNQNNNPP